MAARMASGMYQEREENDSGNEDISAAVAHPVLLRAR